MARVAQFVLIVFIILQVVQANVFLQSPRGSNNRLAEASNVVRNQRRMFDSRVSNLSLLNLGFIRFLNV